MNNFVDSSIFPYFSNLMEQFEEIKEKHKIAKEELIKLWKESSKLPRKKKKIFRKDILSKWKFHDMVDDFCERGLI